MSAKRRHPNVVNVSEVPAQEATKGDRFAMARKGLGLSTGAQKIGCSWYEIPPGKTAFPFHYHFANEESIYVLEGKGTLRIGTQTVAVEPGDYISFPVGEAHAHQLVNDGAGPLRYLCFSTLQTPEVAGYPDSKKFGTLHYERSPEGVKPLVRHLFRDGSSLDYYDGE